MNIILFTLITIFILFVLFGSSEDEENNEITKDEYYKKVDYNDKQKEEMFYHPTTGYKGTRSEMDVYISNRERELKNKEN